MKFIVSRTSDWYDNKPCENAKQMDCFYVDERGFSSFEACKKGCGEDFLAEGINHKVISTKEGNHIIRHLPRKKWVIEFNSLKELMEFILDNGNSVVIETKDEYMDSKGYFIPEIEIYDYWRE